MKDKNDRVSRMPETVNQGGNLMFKIFGTAGIPEFFSPGPE